MILEYLQSLHSILKSYSELDHQDERRISELKDSLKIIDIILSIRDDADEEARSQTIGNISDSKNQKGSLETEREFTDYERNWCSIDNVHTITEIDHMEMDDEEKENYIQTQNLQLCYNEVSQSKNHEYRLWNIQNDNKVNSNHSSTCEMNETEIHQQIRCSHESRKNMDDDQELDEKKLALFVNEYLVLVKETLLTRLHQLTLFDAIYSEKKSLSSLGRERLSNNSELGKLPIPEDNTHNGEILRAVQNCLVKASIGSVENYLSSNLLQKIRECIVFPLQNPDLFIQRKISLCQNILLYGPPGSGKTQLWHSTKNIIENSNCSNISFFEVSSADLLSEWFGKSEKFVQTLFVVAQKMSPSIIFLDEIDGLCSDRTGDSSEVTSRIKTEFLVRLSQLQQSNCFVSVIAATNLPWKIDSAIRRRFQNRIYVKLPDNECRKNIIVNQLQGLDHNLTEKDIDDLILRTELFSISDLVNLMAEVKLNPVRRMQVARSFILNHEGNWEINVNLSSNRNLSFEKDILPDKMHGIKIPPIELLDIPIEDYNPSITRQDLVPFEEFHKAFGTSK